MSGTILTGLLSIDGEPAKLCARFCEKPCGTLCGRPKNHPKDVYGHICHNCASAEAEATR